MIAPYAAQAQAQALVRDTSHFHWYVIPLLLMVLYAYTEQAAERRWSVVLGGITFWLMDGVNEIWNSLLFHFSGYAPAWSAPGDSAYLILIGLNIEISLMFAIMGLLAMRMLPADRKLSLFGMNNRWVIASVSSLLCVMVELWLNHVGALCWEWGGWNASVPYLIWLIGYMPFFVVGYWVHDMPSRRRQIATVVALGTGVALAFILFGGILGWI